VIVAVDQPRELIDARVNEACMTAGVPYIRGGLSRRHARYFSVDPGHGPCRACWEHAREPNELEQATAAGADTTLVQRFCGPNTSVGRPATLVSAVLALEAMRYLTGFAAPAARGVERFIDIKTGAEDLCPWPAWPDCELCAAPSSRAADTSAAAVRT
jgi:hypothetical protein